MTIALVRALRLTLPIVLLAAVGCVQVTSTTPRDACPGESTVIAGSGFGASQGTGTVTFGAATASIVSWSDTAITANVPAGLAGVVNVVVHAVSGSSAPIPFRAIECPMAGAVGAPRLALGPSGQPHVAVSQAGSLMYLTKDASTWSTPETVDALGSGAFDIAVTPDGRPNVVYPQGPANQSNQPGVHRFRDTSGWSPSVVACNDNASFPLFGSCGAIRLVSPGDGTLSVFSIGADRYGANWVSRRDWNGSTWSGANGVDYASIGSHIHDHRAAAGFGTWHLVERRSDYDFGTGVTTYKELHFVPGPTESLATSTADTYGTPAAAASFNRMHFVWRDGSNLVHRYRDMTTGTLSSQATVAAGVTGSPTPVIAADPVGNDGAFALWFENGQLEGSTYSATTGTWSASVLVASNASSAPVAAAYAGVTHVAWLGTAGDLRYTSLP